MPGDVAQTVAAETREAELLALEAMAHEYGQDDLRDALRSVTDSGVALTGAGYGAFFSCGDDEGGGRLDLYVLSGADADHGPDRVPVRSTDLLAPTFAGHGVVRVADVLADPRHGADASAGLPDHHVPIRSYLAVPVATPGGRMLGALLFGHHEPDRFDDRAEVAARAVAEHAATVAENARLLAAVERARQEVERTGRRLALLQTITALLSTAVTTAEVHAQVPPAVTDSLGCSGAHLMLVDPARNALAGTISDAIPQATRQALTSVSLDVPTPSTRAVVTRAPVLVRGRELAEMPGLRGHDLGDVRAVLAVPLLDQLRRPLGVLSAAWVDEDAATPEVTDLLLAVARQTGLALQRTRLFDAEQRARAQLSDSVAALTDLARTLQQGLLPRQVPVLSRVQVAVRYQPAVSGAEVGGDWYDVVPAEDGTVTFVIGDVQGHSTTAAGVMGQLRSAMRAYLTEGHDPATALARTNAVLLQMDAELFATCCLVQLDQATGSVVVATAGHPPPLTLDEDGRITEVDVVPGVPLGITDDAAYEARSLRLCGRTRVLLYTDGVVETAGQPMERGLGAVQQAASAHAAGSCEAIADSVLAGIPHRLTDDAALLVLDYAGPTERRDEVSVVLAPDPGAVAGARRFLRETLAGWGVGGDTADSAELVVSELVTNAVTHTGTPAELEVIREPDAGLLRVAVADGSTRHPAPRDADPDALGGRGLSIVALLTEAWGVADRGDGKVVWAELPLG